MGAHLCYLLLGVFWCCVHLVPVTSRCCRNHCVDDDNSQGVLGTIVLQIKGTVDHQEKRTVDILQTIEQLQQQSNNTAEQLRQENNSTEQLLQQLSTTAVQLRENHQCSSEEMRLGNNSMVQLLQQLSITVVQLREDHQRSTEKVWQDQQLSKELLIQLKHQSIEKHAHLVARLEEMVIHITRKNLLITYPDHNNIVFL